MSGDLGEELRERGRERESLLVCVCVREREREREREESGCFRDLETDGQTVEETYTEREKQR